MNWGILALLVVGGMWACAVFFGYITGAGKAFKKTPPSVSAHASKVKSQQEEFVQDTQSRQEDAMERMRDRISNNRKD